MPPRQLSGSADIEQALRRVGELLEAADHAYAIVIIGGAALGLLGVVARTTPVTSTFWRSRNDASEAVGHSCPRRNRSPNP